MKRIIRLATLVLAMVLISTVTFAQHNAIDVIINDKAVDFSLMKNGNSMGYPYIENGRTYVPIRVISEGLGYKIDWIQSKQTAVIVKGQTKVEIKIGETKALVNGVRKYIDVDSEGNVGNTKAMIKNGRTYVPVRFIAETMGEKVEYRSPYSSSVYNTTIYINSTDVPTEMDKGISGDFFEEDAIVDVIDKIRVEINDIAVK